MKKRLLFVITQFYKGGAETSLLNLFCKLDSNKYEVDFLILNQEEYVDATSLIESIPEWIRVYDVIKENSSRGKFERLEQKIYRRLFKTEKTYSKRACEFVRNKEYDAAFSFGEWLSPAFVANKVRAKRKYVWIHIDLSKASFVNKAELVKYDEKIAGYIFASNESLKSAMECCPQMENKAIVVHNFFNETDVLKKAEEAVEVFSDNSPYLLSVGNLREEKNYPRQIEVMRILKERHVPIKWVCVGSTVNRAVYETVSNMLKQYQLQDDFIFCGADDNPYKYMKRAAAVTVLSDYESWSLVISEARMLGIPVIATNTSGAREQLIDGETGIITGFLEQEIADRVESFLKDKHLQERIRKNLEKTDIMESGLQEFENTLQE